ncbi:hypothetical protein B0H13DRAFT_2340168 [Mycena leptocephala]|nr:hypothetical protein B0H13DRAFT_2340168 [Mycena leptocephala]
MSSPLTIVFLQTPPRCFIRRPRPLYTPRMRACSLGSSTPAAPFGVHRMTLAGKAVGKNVGMWFRPSAAASAIRWVAHSVSSALLMSFGYLRTWYIPCAHAVVFAPAISSYYVVDPSSSSSYPTRTISASLFRRATPPPIVLSLVLHTM